MIDEPISAFFIGCVQSTEVSLKAALARSEIDVRGILTKRNNSYNSDFVDISKLAADSGCIVIYEEDTNDTSLANILVNLKIDVVFVIGWSRLLTSEILNIPRYGVIGFHPSALPRNRGRHPLIWSLALGLDETASTFFSIDQGTDSGPILSQEFLQITREDTAQSLYDKIMMLIPTQIDGIIDQMVSGYLCGVQQDHTLATSWRKRSDVDGLIDWRMSAIAVFNLTRALTHPYIGAEFEHKDHVVKLWRCEVVIEGVPRTAEPGKVLEVDARGPLIKTGLGADGGAVRLLDIQFCPELKKGDYL
jgi:methionyl-tRNA formyltransferase